MHNILYKVVYYNQKSTLIIQDMNIIKLKSLLWNVKIVHVTKDSTKLYFHIMVFAFFI